MILIVMGVSGSGKTTIGRTLAESRNLPFFDADDFHSPSNIEKMRSGMALTDEDRRPWLDELAEKIQLWDKAGGAVLACSALKEDYRKILQSVRHITWIYLDGSRDTILNRLHSRKAHYMSPTLLESQLEALEKPAYGLHIDISSSPEQILQEINSKLENMLPMSEFGLIGLGVMGKSLALNLASHQVRVSIYNRHVPGKEEGVAEKMLAEYPDINNMKGFDSLEEFVQSLERPRKILLMIYAGAIDSQIEELVPLLDQGDIIVDGGNSFYKDTARREAQLEKQGLLFLGAGISGGEEGALKGPSIMPGGSERAYLLVAPFLDKIAAKDQTNQPCSTYIGPAGSGHFVKMVHNGIEYAEMQALAEVYSLLRYFLGFSPLEVSAILSDWQDSELSSYLLGITVEILRKKEGEHFLIDLIVDQAEQKGTGGLSVAAALEYGVPYHSLSEAVMARAISARKVERVHAASLYNHHREMKTLDRDLFTEKLKNAYQSTRIINHEIGFNLMREVSLQNRWALDFSEISRIWTNGCIIRSRLMEDLSILFVRESNILTSASMIEDMKNWKADLAYCVSEGLQAGIALPVFSSALNYFLSYTTADSSANLIQAQRDYFGAHTYQRKDKPAGHYFHSNWKAE